VSDQSPPTGWYPDPQVAGLVRWWDGRWTEYVQEAVTRTSPPPPSQRSQPLLMEVEP
jgi:hypothetical protein